MKSPARPGGGRWPVLACVAQSPTAPAVAREARRLAQSLGRGLRFLHVGDDRPETRAALEEMLGSDALLDIRAGRVEEVAAEAAEGAGLLVLGALEEEGPLGFLVSSVARRIARSAPCPVLLLPMPRAEAVGFRRIVASLHGDEPSEEMLRLVLDLARAEQVDILHLVQEYGLPGLDLALDDGADTHQTDLERRVARILAENRLANFLEDHDLADLPVRVASLEGREGWEVVQYARDHSADLLVVPPPEDTGTLWDRLFPRGTDLTLQALPCALLVFRDGSGTR